MQKESLIVSFVDEEVASDVVVGVGAYIGDYTIPLAERACKVIAYEPNPHTTTILEKNIHLNQARNVKLFAKVVGETKS